MKTIILAAGVGKRLWPLTAACPKCLLRCGGQSLLARLLTALERPSVREVVIVVGYLRQKIIAAVARSGTQLTYAMARTLTIKKVVCSPCGKHGRS